MERSLHIRTYFNIPIKIHWSFGLLLLFVLYVGISNNLSASELSAFGIYILVLFICVILHEYGHALMARKFGTKTRDIIISPIGGVARLESIPEEPYKELLIALAGPAVNVVIGILTAFLTLILFSGGVFPSNPSDFTFLKYPSEFIRYITLLNAMLFFFNLIPAFPMDGGRVLRSLLSMGMSRYQATKIATFIGKILAVVFVSIGLYYNHMFLGLIGLFVYFAANSEFKSLQLVNRLKQITAGSIMRKSFKFFRPFDSAQDVIAYMVSTKERNFIVLDDYNRMVGTIPYLFLKELNDKESDKQVGDIMSTKTGGITPYTSMYDTYTILNREGMAIVPVVEHDEILGVIDRDLVSEIIKNNGMVPDN